MDLYYKEWFARDRQYWNKYDSPGRCQRLDLFIKVISVLCYYLTDASIYIIQIIRSAPLALRWELPRLRHYRRREMVGRAARPQRPLSPKASRPGCGYPVPTGQLRNAPRQLNGGSTAAYHFSRTGVIFYSDRCKCLYFSAMAIGARDGPGVLLARGFGARNMRGGRWVIIDIWGGF